MQIANAGLLAGAIVLLFAAAANMAVCGPPAPDPDAGSAYLVTAAAIPPHSSGLPPGHFSSQGPIAAVRVLTTTTPASSIRWWTPLP
jgi:hypothetical protein